MVMHPHTNCHWPISKEKNVIARTRKYYLKTNWPWGQRSRSNEGHYGTRHTDLWSCTHIPNIIDLSRKTKKLCSGQASLRSAKGKTAIVPHCTPSFKTQWALWTRLTWRVPLVEHLSLYPVFSGFKWGSCYSIFSFVDRCLSHCTFSFGHCVVCSSLIYEFWFSLWYLQTLLLEKL